MCKNSTCEVQERGLEGVDHLVMEHAGLITPRVGVGLHQVQGSEEMMCCDCRESALDQFVEQKTERAGYDRIARTFRFVIDRNLQSSNGFGVELEALVN